MVNLLLGVAVLCFLFAALFDLYCRRIPNYIVMPVFMVAIISKIYSSYYTNIFIDMIPFFVILGAGVFAFQYGVLAGGDVKLLSVSGYIVGMGDWVVFCFWAAVFGGVLALIILAWQLIRVFWGIIFRQRKARLNLGGIELPYGVAIAAAAILVMAQQRGMGVIEVSL